MPSNIGTKYHSNSAYPTKFLVAKYLPQIAPETVSEHEHVKNFLGGIPPDPPPPQRCLRNFFLDLHATVQPPKPRSAPDTPIIRNTSALRLVLGECMHGI